MKLRTANPVKDRVNVVFTPQASPFEFQICTICHRQNREMRRLFAAPQTTIDLPKNLYEIRVLEREAYKNFWMLRCSRVRRRTFSETNRLERDEENARIVAC